MGSYSYDVVDWRRRVQEIYRAVRLEPDVRTAHARWAEERRQLLLTHPVSPVPRPPGASEPPFEGGRVAPYDEAFRFVVPVEPAELLTREVVTGTDGTVVMERAGVLTLSGLGAVDLWWLTGYGGGLFLPLRDATSGRSTYGGGRYVLDTAKGADLGGSANHLVVDLNFAYQPSCAYDPAWACPLPGPGNTLAAAVPVGELYAQE
jgi:uncharacterized protein (DUF1684 family)